MTNYRYASFALSASVVLVFVLMSSVEVECKQCLKDQSLPAYPINTYECDENSTLSECCEQNNEFTCCQSQETYTWIQQLILWGSIIGVVTFAILAWLCFRKDTNICETGKRCCEGCCGHFGKKYERPEDDPNLRPGSASSQHHYTFNPSYSFDSAASPSPSPYSPSPGRKSRPVTGARSISVAEANEKFNDARPISVTGVQCTSSMA